MTKPCIICNKNPKVKGKSYCGGCYHIKNKSNPSYLKYQLKRKELIINYKNKGCEKCGEKRHWLLDFHYINKENKEKAIYNIMGIPRLLKEIDKCIVLCSNCHRDFHYLEKTQNINIINYLKK